MKIYQDLEFRGDPEALDRLPSEIEQRLTDGWSRNHEREAELRRTLFGRMYCFSCIATTSRPASTLALAAKSAEILHVSNVVPTDLPSLSHDEYNSILQEFCTQFGRPAADALGVTTELGASEVCIEDLLSDATTRLLKTFSSAANRAVMHPLDRKRWNEFLTAAHREQAPLDSALLERWLIEEEKWPADRVEDLIRQYENAQQLLEVYESQQV